MKIMILGAYGQLGSEIKKKLIKENIIYTPTSNDCNLNDIFSTRSYLDRFKNLDFIINCAAFTDVELAEVREKECMNVNYFSVLEIANYCKFNNVKLIHFSTDYVFDGLKSSPYEENDQKKPLNIYGKSKSFAEDGIIASNCKYLIFRISWIYSKSNNSFLYKVIQKIIKNEKLNIVNDQIGVPNSVCLIAESLHKIIKENKFFKSDTYNMVCNGSCSWYDFAVEICKNLGVNNPSLLINSISTEDLNQNVKRPKYSLLSNQKIKKDFMLAFPDWKQDLKIFMEKNE